MKSPFPGMDPYLERHWKDVHASLIIYARDFLQPQLPGKLVARVEERLVVEPDDTEERSIYPDVRVTEHGRGASRQSNHPSKDAALAEPIIVLYSEAATETYLQIVEPGSDNRLVTVIELLSLSNKLAGESQNQYRQKQHELKAADVSLVEIDLLRSGKRVFSLPASSMPKRARATYQACVRRGWRPGAYEIYPMPLKHRLPALRIPLRKTDDDVALDLQHILDQAYINGAYGATVDYRQPPEPPLRAEEADWAKQLLRGLRR